jgi:hypothetical protein
MVATQISDEQLEQFYAQMQSDLDIADRMKPSFARDKIIRDVWLRLSASEQHTTREQRERVLDE